MDRDARQFHDAGRLAWRSQAEGPCVEVRAHDIDGGDRRGTLSFM